MPCDIYRLAFARKCLSHAGRRYVEEYSAGISAVLTLPSGWLLFWWLGVITLGFHSAEDKAIG